MPNNEAKRHHQDTKMKLARHARLGPLFLKPRRPAIPSTRHPHTNVLVLQIREPPPVLAEEVPVLFEFVHGLLVQPLVGLQRPLPPVGVEQGTKNLHSWDGWARRVLLVLQSKLQVPLGHLMAGDFVHLAERRERPFLAEGVSGLGSSVENSKFALCEMTSLPRARMLQQQVGRC